MFRKDIGWNEMEWEKYDFSVYAHVHVNTNILKTDRGLFFFTEYSHL